MKHEHYVYTKNNQTLMRTYQRTPIKTGYVYGQEGSVLRQFCLSGPTGSMLIFLKNNDGRHMLSDFKIYCTATIRQAKAILIS